MAFCLSFPEWCNTYTLAEKIKALEHQTFSTHFTSKFMLFWITQKLTFFTHPNIKIAKNGNAPIHWRGFHAFFKNSWPSPPPKISRIVTSFIFRHSLHCVVQAEAGQTVTVPDPGSKNIKTMTEFDTSWTEMKKPPVKPNTNWNSNKRYLHIFSD